MSYAHKMDFNRRAEEVSGIQVLSNVAKAFGMFWWFFGALSIWATYFTLDLVLGSWDIDPIVLTAVIFGLAVIWEIFKYFSMEWVFAEQVLSTNITSKVVLIVVAGGSMLFHIYGAELRNSDTATKKVVEEVGYQRKVAEQKLELQNKLLDSNKDLAPVLLNGSSRDDAGTVGTMNLTLKLIEKMQKEKNEGITTEELLSIYGKDIKVKSDGIMYAQIIAEMFLLFSLLSKFIYKANRDEQLKDFMEAKQELSELLYLAKTDVTAQFVNAALDELNGYTMTTNQTGLGLIKQKIERARADIRPDMEIEDKTSKPQAQEPVEQKRPILLGAGLKEDHEPTIRRVVEDECADIEADVNVKEEIVQAENEKVKALDLKMFDEDEKKMLRILFDGGTIHKGEPLVKREVAVIEASEKGVARASSALTALYGNLLKTKMIIRPNLNDSYISNVSLSKDIWTDKG